MATNTLNDKTIRAAKASAKAVRLFDGGGLYLKVAPTGSKLWRLKYRFVAKEKRLAVGAYPLIGLQDARARRGDARRQLANGVDPSAAKKALNASRVAVDANSFEAVAREWHTEVHAHSVSASHAARTPKRFENDIFPALGSRSLAAIEAPELLAVLRKIEARGAIETAHRAKDSCEQVFRYGVATGRCLRNPAANLRDALRPVTSRHHAAMVDPKVGGELLRDIVRYAGQPVTRCALTLSAMLLLRPGELRQMEWSSVDLAAATAKVPASLMKRKKTDKLSGDPNVVPLATQALKTFGEFQSLTGGGRFVFPPLQTGDRLMSKNRSRQHERFAAAVVTERSSFGFVTDRAWTAQQALKSEPARWGLESAVSAWSELALVLNTEAHLWRESAIEAVEVAVRSAIAGLQPQQRLALWIACESSARKQEWRMVMDEFSGRPAEFDTGNMAGDMLGETERRLVSDVRGRMVPTANRT